MTTYTVQGISFSFDEFDNLASFSTATLSIVTEESVSGFFYTYDVPPVPGDPTSVAVTGVGGSLISAYFNGDPTMFPQDDETSVLELTWVDDPNNPTQTFTSYVLAIDSLDSGGGEFVFFLGGDPLPTMTTIADFEAFNLQLTGVSDVPPGTPYSASTTIAFATLPGVTSTEYDAVDGSDDDDSISTGIGNDSIWGNLGSDFINAGAGDDYINPGDNNDFDVILAGSGADTIDFGDLAIGYVGLDHYDLNAGIVVNVNGNTNSGSISKGANGSTTLVDVANPIIAGANIGGLGIGGTNFADAFNVTSANGGWMQINGRGGADSYTFGASTGAIRLSFSGSTGGVAANFSTGAVANDGWGNAETITGVGNVTEFQLSEFADSVVGSAGDDRFILLAGNDTLNAGAGNDLVRYDRAGVSAVNVNLATQTATGSWGGNFFTHTLIDVENVRGSRDGSDVIRGDAESNAFFGRGGNDTLIGNGGNDFLFGEDGHDLLGGGDGDDSLDGGLGNDAIYGADGNDTVVGGDGDDSVFGGNNDDLVGGGEGHDSVDGGGRNDSIYGANGNDTLVGGSGWDKLYGGNDNDLLGGGSGKDLLDGGAGDDSLYGANHNDTLIGGGGNDLLVGGAGIDVMNGGAGADVFDFNATSDSTTAARDTIQDFSAADLLDLSTIDANTTVGGNQAFTFIGSAAFSAAGQVRFATNGTDGFVQADVNGDGVIDMNIRLLGVTSMVAGDFIL